MHVCHPVVPGWDLPRPHQSPNFSPPPDILPLPPQSSPGPNVAVDDPDLPEAEFTDASGQYYRTYHALLNGQPCMADGMFLPPGTPPTFPPPKSPRDWSPYRNDMEFATAEFVFKQSHMSNAATDQLFDLMAAQLLEHNGSPPFVDHKDLHRVINATQLGNVPWQCFSVQYMGNTLNMIPLRGWTKNMRSANPTYKGEIDFVPFREYDASDNTHQWKDFMSGDWAWQQADEISKDPSIHGSTFVLIILSSDKTTVSVGTGNNEYYPLYASIGNVHNNVRHAHRDALIVIGFLSIPKTVREHAKTESFRIFHRQLFHHSLSAILTEPEACNDRVQGPTLCRRSFSMCHIRIRTLHSRLRGTIGVILYGEKLVCKMSCNSNRPQ
ncbi:hypothetical protein EV424DRAFT_1543155 [Suillus variegatus]|nr:hypothetical protein EV424DRAFT_1543155 [Suillus variegatus]